MKLLGIDLETTSVDVATCHITEIGMVLWDTEHQQSLFQFGGLVRLSRDVEIPEQAQKITGISNEMVHENGLTWDLWERQILFLMNQAEGFVAHNAQFDRTILERYLQMETDALWVDTMTDLPYPEHIVTRKLDYLCYEHGFANPFSHRALTDVLSMFKVMSMYPLDEILVLAKSPMIWLRADVSIDDRQKAKDRRYIWDPLNKYWVKSIKQLFAAQEIDEAPFGVRVLEDYEYKQSHPRR